MSGGVLCLVGLFLCLKSTGVDFMPLKKHLSTNQIDEGVIFLQAIKEKRGEWEDLASPLPGFQTGIGIDRIKIDRNSESLSLSFFLSILLS